MNNWQQVSERTDPWPDVPFEDETVIYIDSIVGAVCIVAAILVYWFGA